MYLKTIEKIITEKFVVNEFGEFRICDVLELLEYLKEISLASQNININNTKLEKWLISIGVIKDFNGRATCISSYRKANELKEQLEELTKNEDFFLNNSNVISRLVEEWKQHENLIIAFDYDNTVYDYHQKGYTYNNVIELLRECKEFGAYLMVYTACDEEKFPDITKYLQDNDIPFDSINVVPKYIPFTGKKLYYNTLLDDRAGLSSAYNCLKEALRIMKN